MKMRMKKWLNSRGCYNPELNKKFKHKGGSSMEAVVRIKPILPTPTLDESDSEMILKNIMKPISRDLQDSLKRRRELMLKNRVK